MLGQVPFLLINLGITQISEKNILVKVIFHNMLKWEYSLSSVPFIKKMKVNKTGIEIFFLFLFLALYYTCLFKCGLCVGNYRENK